MRCYLDMDLLTHARTGGSVWLKEWSEVNDVAGGNPDVVKYILIYFAFGIGSAALVVMQTLILWIFCSIEVSLIQGTPNCICTTSRLLRAWTLWRCGPKHANARTGLTKTPRENGVCGTYRR